MLPNAEFFLGDLADAPVPLPPKLWIPFFCFLDVRLNFFWMQDKSILLANPESYRRWGEAVFKITAISYQFFFSVGQKSPWIKGSSPRLHPDLAFVRVFPIFFGSAYIGSGVGAENVPTPPGGCPPSTALPAASTSRLWRVSNISSLFVVCGVCLGNM